MRKLIDRVTRGQPVSSVDLGGIGGSKGPPPRSQNSGAPRSGTAQAAVNLRYLTDQVIAEVDSSQADDLARRHRLRLIGSQDVPLVGSAFSLFGIADRRSAETVRTELAADASVRSVQLNFRYVLQDQKSVPAEGDPAQYALTKLRLPEAHALSRGANVTVAVIDSGIDVAHPELKDAIAESFDALGGKEGSKQGPHVHGTGIAGAIVSHARLMGSAPKARILAIRAFGAAANGAESTSFVILKSLDFAASHGAQIVNMSFAGPKDPLVERGIAAAATKGMVLVAASGNAGPKSPPLYPAANPDVIAVSATDAHDRLFPASNRGGHIALAAPGVDIFLPAPDGKAPAPMSYSYQDLGTNIDCYVFSPVDGQFRVEITIDDSSIYDDSSTSASKTVPGVPSFRSFRASDSMVLKDGGTAQFTTATDKVSGEIVKVDVTLTVVK